MYRSAGSIRRDCAQGVLDPLMIPGPVSRSGSFFSFLSIPGGMDHESVILGGSLAAPWRILVVGRDFFSHYNP